MRHKIMQVATHEDGATYRVSIRLPEEKGWMENVKLYILKFGEQRIYNLRFVKRNEEYAYFETEIYLESCHFIITIFLLRQMEHCSIAKTKTLLENQI